ncbi:hypothetical protein O7635_06750 [Asanoa sp. WMMD1127]|uniref:hypothetical protein n=1 Tax=Asanoa sp. WMMD1127 TaxID=3016107 RepID=UPI002417B703|nr:hypothetical protein [Asanoa sp. WMMD1127]MDG4821554.1 hypothetical protein [Asanoa sp. WMMD1127]
MTSPLSRTADHLDALAADLGDAAPADLSGAAPAGLRGAGPAGLRGAGPAGLRGVAPAGLRGAVAGELGPTAFGGNLPGALGALGRSLHGRWEAAEFDHARAAASLAARLTETAAALRSAGAGYAGVEESTARRASEAGGDQA